MINFLRNYLRASRNQVSSLLDSYSESWVLQLVRGWIDNRRNRLPEQSISLDLDVDGTPNISFLVATKGQGLLLFEEGGVTRITDRGHFYGLSRLDEYWYVFQKTGRTGRIIRFLLSDGHVAQPEVVVWGLSKGVHQIDFVGDRLLAMDTYNNRILSFSGARELQNAYWKRMAHEYFPNGYLSEGRKSENYNHFNSLFASGEKIYVVAHNETTKTGRKSEIYILSKCLRTIDKLEIKGSNSHNVFLSNKGLTYCASMEGSVVVKGVHCLKTDMFTRGLSIGDDFNIVGGSQVNTNRRARGQGEAKVWITNKKYEILYSIEIPQAQIHEIRRIDHADYGLSNTSK